MAIVLYKKGSLAKINGIICQIQICNEFSYLHLLEEGWFYTPEEVVEVEIEEKKAAKKKKKEKEKEKSVKAKTKRAEEIPEFDISSLYDNDKEPEDAE